MSLKAVSSKDKNSSQPNMKVHGHLQRTVHIFLEENCTTIPFPLHPSVNVNQAQ